MAAAVWKANDVWRNLRVGLSKRIHQRGTDANVTQRRKVLLYRRKQLTLSFRLNQPVEFLDRWLDDLPN